MYGRTLPDLDGPGATLAGVLFAIFVVVFLGIHIHKDLERTSLGDDARDEALARCLQRAPAESCEQQMSKRHDACLYRTYDTGGPRGRPSQGLNRPAYFRCMRHGPDNFTLHR